VIRSPDELLWRYLRLRERLGSPRARQTVAETGLVFGGRCSECGAAEKLARLEELSKDTLASRFRCSNCNAAWPVDVAFLLRNEFQSSRRHDSSSLYDQLASYGRILSSLSIREQRVYLLLYLYEGIGGYADVAQEMNRRFPRSLPPRGARGPQLRAGGWSEWSVRQTVNAARRSVRRGLEDRRL